MKTHIHKTTKLLTSFIIVSLCGVISAQAANYDGTYNALADGFAECPAIPPYVPPILEYSPPSFFTFTITNGVLSTGGTVDSFGNIFYQFGAAGATVTVTGTISFTGYVTNGRVSITGLPAGCTAGGTWSAQPGQPAPNIVPSLPQWPAPASLMPNVDEFSVSVSGLSPDSVEFIKTTASETKALTRPASGNYLKDHAGPAADVIKDACENISNLQASVSGRLNDIAMASIGIITPELPVTDSFKRATEGALFIGALSTIAVTAAPEELLLAMLVEANLQICKQALVPSLQQVDHDPTDPNYRIVAPPDPVKVPALPLTGNTALDNALAKSYFDTLLAQSHLGAVNTAFNRYSSAYAAGDTTSVALQLEAFLDNLSRYNREMQDAAADLKALPALIHAAGIADPTVDSQGLANVKNYIRANGLPANVMQTLTYFGFTPAQIQMAVDQALAANPSSSDTLSASIEKLANGILAATSNPATQLYNISTRGFVGTGFDILDGGFIIQGTVPKTVMIRAIGPELTKYGVPRVLADPMLDLHDESGNIIASNDDWQHTTIAGIVEGSQVNVIQNTGTLVPGDTRESALVVTLPPGKYTAVVHGKNNTSGVALVEIYDLSPDNDSILHNISTRGFVQTGSNILDGGFIVKGPEQKTVIVRAIGPELTQYGVPGALADPTLELHDGTGALIASNDNWQTTVIGGIISSDQVTGIQNSGHAPGDPREAAIVATLRPGNYTAIIRGKNNTTGVALVEVYDLN
jgi:hypothetical protein